MIFEPDELTELENAVRQIYKKDFLSNQEMVAQFNKSLGIKEESKRQFEEKKEREKSIGRVDVIDTGKGDDSYRELKQLFMLYADENQNNLFDLNDLRNADKSGELMKIKEVLDDLINTPNMDKEKIIYYKSQVNMIDDFIYNKGLMAKRIKNIQLKKKEEDEIRKPRKTKRKKESTTPRAKPPSTPNPLKSIEEEKIIEQIKNSPVMQQTAKFYEKLNDNFELENYLSEVDELVEKNKSVKNEKENKKTYANLMNRRRAILTSMERIYQDEIKKRDELQKQGAVESKQGTPKISGNGMKTPTQKKSKKQGKTQAKNKSNNKSLGKQEQIYYLLSQRSGNNNKLMKKRLKQNKK